MGRLSSFNQLLFVVSLCFSIGRSDFRRTHNDYDPNPVNMEMGWGAIHCIDFQEVSTLWREVTFEPALVVTCELKSHQCITIRAVNDTHYYTFQGCLPQARVPKICTELAYASSMNKGAEYFHCYDVSYDRLNVPANAPLAGRECCCNGELCNRIENVKTIDTIIPHDQILSPMFRTLHLWYWNALRMVGLLSIIAIIFFWGNIVYIVLKPAEREDDSAWYAAPIPHNQINDEDNYDEDEEVVDAVIDIAEAEAKAKVKEVEASKKKKKGAKKRASKEEANDSKKPLQTEKTQECSLEDSLPVAKTGDDGEEKKDEKKPVKEKNEKEKKEEAPNDDKEKKTQEPDPKKEEKPEDAGGQFKLGKAKRLANGRVQYISMFNENSDYSDDDDEKK